MYWIFYRGKSIINKDYMDVQTGEYNLGEGTSVQECKTLEEVTKFVSDNGLSLITYGKFFTLTKNELEEWTIQQ